MEGASADVLAVVGQVVPALQAGLSSDQATREHAEQCFKQFGSTVLGPCDHVAPAPPVHVYTALHRPVALLCCTTHRCCSPTTRVSHLCHMAGYLRPINTLTSDKSV